MSLKKAFVHGNGLNRADVLVDYKLFHAVDQQHGIAVREHRHHPADVIIAEVAPRHWP